MKRNIKPTATGFSLKNWLKSAFSLVGAGAASCAPAASEGPKAEPPKVELTKAHLLAEWRPAVKRRINVLAVRYQFYTNGAHALVIFEHGTCVLVPNELEETQAYEFAIGKLAEYLNAHPDGTPLNMKDGNFVANAPQVDAMSLVMQETLLANAEYIEANYEKGLQGQPSHEVIFTPQGQNVFDETGKHYLFARSFIFWDADELHPVLFIPAKNRE